MVYDLLQGKRILITGSSRGIGAATARLAKDYGAEVILHGRTDSDKLKRLASELNADYICCDASDEGKVREVIAETGGLDVLVNNAGMQRSKPFLELTTQDWEDVYKTNVFGIVNFSKAVLPLMQSQGYGRIVNISSAKAFPATAGRAAYASAKAAVNQLTVCMAKELAQYGILVNAVAPGFVETEMTAQTWSDRIKKQVDDSLLGRMARPEEIAEAVLWLASDKNGFMTGQTILVDGGFGLSIK